MYINKRKIRVAVKKYRVAATVGVIGGLALTATYWGLYINSNYDVSLQSPIKIEQKELLSPIPKREVLEIATRGAQIQLVPQVQAAEVQPSPTPEPRVVKGEASYYSRSGCLGCNKNMIMANGESLDDSKLTLALTPQMVKKYKLLNDFVTVENIKTGKTVRARVTDTGGFARHNRVADLSVATKDAINCASLCQVKITY